MTSNEALSMYEHLAGLTNRMVLAAQAGDWDCLAQLETRCAIAAAATAAGVPALQGAQRERKVDLLKQILANDRAIRDVTQPWMGRIERAMSTH